MNQDTDNDIEKLIERTETEGEQEEQNKGGALSFSFAKIWEADKDSLTEVGDQDQGDSWAQTLEKITAEREKIRSQEIMLSGRGAPRRAAMAKVFVFFMMVFGILLILCDSAECLRGWGASQVKV